ncbi:MAG: ATP-binding cassette domain-containing protein [Acutalibacteraceae bacterium]
MEFKNINFKYPDSEENVLKNVSFVINPGEKIGVVGTIGSGKSTLGKLISGLYSPSDGKVLYDGNLIPESEVLKFVSYMPQNAPLFIGSIESNMRIAKSDATEEEIICALEDAQIGDFVKKYGLSKNIYGSSLSVSGGERQRISIARNLLKKAAIYIFDDSFANLDFKTDLSLRKSILSRLKNNTVILISQRISTIKNLDKIIVLESGNLIGFDSHKNLMRNCPTYKKMVNLQLGGGE